MRINTMLLLVLAFVGYKVQAQNNDKAVEQNNLVRNGLWICSTPVSTIDLDRKLVEASQNGIKLTHEVTEQLVQQNGNCERLDADNIKPIGVFPEASYQIVRVSDGKQEGWTPLEMYVAYMRFHVVRKPETK